MIITIGAEMEMEAGVMEMEAAPQLMVTPANPLIVTLLTEASIVMLPRFAVGGNVP